MHFYFHRSCSVPCGIQSVFYLMYIFAFEPRITRNFTSGLQNSVSSKLKVPSHYRVSIGLKHPYLLWVMYAFVYIHIYLNLYMNIIVITFGCLKLYAYSFPFGVHFLSVQMKTPKALLLSFFIL